MKRWQGSDQRLRWVASGLLWAESRWNKIHHAAEIPVLMKELELAVVKQMPLRRAKAGNLDQLAECQEVLLEGC